MNARIKRKYTKWNCKCVHEFDKMNWNKPFRLCTAHPNGCDGYCYCKEYKPVRVSVLKKRLIKYVNEWCKENKL